MKQTIALLGDGAWGTAIATLLAYRGHTVKLWCYNAELVEQINRAHLNQKYLPDVTLSPSIIAYGSLSETVKDVGWVFEAIPVKYLRNVLLPAKKSFADNKKWVTLSKGIEQDTLMLSSEIIQDILGSSCKIAAVSGPSFARDVARKQAVAVAVAADTSEFADLVCDLLTCDYVTTYSSTDIIGVQLSGALKNSIALAITMLEGAGYSESTRAFVLTKGLREIEELVVAMGGDRETVYGLAGLGDIVLTAYSNQSKNAQVGKKLGQGIALDTILADIGYVPEGINTLQSVLQLANRYNLALPLCRGLHAVIFEQKSIEQFVKNII